MTRILHLSDPHFGASDPSVAEEFLHRAADMKPDLTVLSGDLTMRARRSELEAAAEFVNRLPTPRIVIPGNHDIPALNQPFDRFFRPFARYSEYFGEDLEPRIATSGVQVVSLNSTRPFGFHADWSEGRLSRTQLSEIPRAFATAPPATTCRALVLHHPLLALQVPGRRVVRPLGPLLKVLETAQVDLVFCGHFHRSQIRSAGMTYAWRSIISQAPTVCSTRLQGEPQGYHEIRVSDDRITTHHHVWQGGGFVAADSQAFSRSAGGWSACAM